MIFIFLLSSLLLFSQTWETLTELPINGGERHHPVTFSIDGIGYVATGAGMNQSGGTVVFRDVNAYDPTTDTWSSLNLFPGAPRGFSYGVGYKGKGYMGFGLGVINGQFNYMQDLWEYDPETDTWTELESCPCTGRYHPAFAAANDKLFVGLGSLGNGSSGLGNGNDWWEYDIENNSWRQLPDLPSYGRHHPFYFTIGDDVYAGLGHGSIADNDGNVIYDDWFKWDTNNETWTELSEFPGEGRVAGTQFSNGSKGYVLSGQGEDHRSFAEGEFYEYDPETDTWKALTSHPGKARWAPGSFVIDDYVYFFGGQSRQDASDGFTRNEKDLMRFPLGPSSSVRDDIELVELYPNPAVDFVKFDNSLNVSRYEVINSSGEVVLNGDTNSEMISLENITSGYYTIKLYSNDETKIGKVIVVSDR